jgi:hypothetical protein
MGDISYRRTQRHLREENQKTQTRLRDLGRRMATSSRTVPQMHNTEKIKTLFCNSSLPSARSNIAYSSSRGSECPLSTTKSSFDESAKAGHPKNNGEECLERKLRALQKLHFRRHEGPSSPYTYVRLRLPLSGYGASPLSNGLIDKARFATVRDP